MNTLAYKFQPQTPLGARFGTVSPVVGFAASDVTLRERSDIGGVLLTTAVDDPEVRTAAGAAAAGVVLASAPGMTSARVGRAAHWLSPRSWLIQCGVHEELELVARMNDAVPNKLAHAVSFGDALCWLELSGEGAFELLTEGGFLSLERGGFPIGHAKRTLIAQIVALIVRDGQSVWLIAVERSRARYFADWLIAFANGS